jgi:predicted enzyme related to lactoylglutathione lyase
MSSHPVAWFDIYAQDMDRAKRFYEAVLRVLLRPLAPPLSALELWACPSDMAACGASGSLVKIERNLLGLYSMH